MDRQDRRCRYHELVHRQPQDFALVELQIQRRDATDLELGEQWMTINDGSAYLGDRVVLRELAAAGYGRIDVLLVRCPLARLGVR
jgi:hypothetical protein